MTVVGSDLPPEIKRLVDEAGVDNAFWSSNRGRHGKKPPIGEAADEMTNAVPGSTVTATQSTTSAQPIATNRGYSFEGDDKLVTTAGVYTPSDGYFVMGVIRDVPSSPEWTRIINRVRNPSIDYHTRFDFRFESTAIGLDLVDDSGTALEQYNSITTNEPISFAAKFNGSDTIKVWVRQSASTAKSDKTKSIGTFSDFTDGMMGNLTGHNRHLDADIAEIFEANVSPDDKFIDESVRRLAHRHGLA